MGDMDTIGSRLKAERIAQGLTQEALANACGLTKQGISHIETNRTGSPQASTLEPICRKLGISVRWLLDGKSPKHIEQPASQPLRIDADTIADAQDALTAIARINGIEKSDILAWISDPYRLALAIDTVLTVKHSGAKGDNIIDLMARIAQNIRQGEENAVGKAGHGGSYPAAATPVGK